MLPTALLNPSLQLLLPSSHDQMNMPKIGINTGIILIALALLGYLGGGMESWTTLIPAIAGAPILLSTARNLLLEESP